MVRTPDTMTAAQAEHKLQEAVRHASEQGMQYKLQETGLADFNRLHYNFPDLAQVVRVHLQAARPPGQKADFELRGERCPLRSQIDRLAVTRR